MRVCRFISVGALREHLRAGNGLTIVDVRSPDLYAGGHLPGALSIPVDKLRDRRDEVPVDRPVVAYCGFRNPGASAGERAAALLRESGYDAQVLYGGYPAWREAGYEVESTRARARSRDANADAPEPEPDGR